MIQDRSSSYSSSRGGKRSSSASSIPSWDDLFESVRVSEDDTHTHRLMYMYMIGKCQNKASVSDCNVCQVIDYSNTFLLMHIVLCVCVLEF